MCWLCDFNKTNPTDEQRDLARMLFSKFIDVMDEAAALPKQHASFEYACAQAARLIRTGNRRKPVEKISEAVGRTIVEAMQAQFGVDVEIEIVGSTSLNRRSTDNVVPIKGKLDHATQTLFNAIETPIDGKVH